MGDDLNFAQKFTRTAADGLAILAEMSDPRAKTDAPVVINMMTTVQRGAKRLRARNIYVGAQNVLSALHHETDDVLSGRIETLGSLVTEYARGLDDLLTQSQPAVRTPLSVKDKWDTARETLNALLPIADPDSADVLSRLMRASDSLDSVSSDPAADDRQNADVLPFKQVDAQSEFASDVHIEDMEDDVALESIIAETPSDLPLDLTEVTLAEAELVHAPTRALVSVAPIETETVALDAMMRDVIADALSVARSINRTISLSYDMGERTVSENVANDLRHRIGKALSQIIRQALTDDRVGHIDINLAGEQLHIMAGTTAMRVAIVPDAIPRRKPLITTETEQGLRAQLDALLDPITFHETAS
jgi:hypothetical protein